MTIQYNWKITGLEYNNNEDKAVFSVSWQCKAEEMYENNMHYADCYGKEYLSVNVESDTFIAYEDITEEIALNWLYNLEAFDSTIIEQNLAEQLLLTKKPKTSKGTPWA